MSVYPNISKEKFGSAPDGHRRTWWEWRAKSAEWTVPEGPLGDLVLQLRRRGNDAHRSAQLVLVTLLITIVVGLGYYVGVPIWEQYVDGRRQTYEDQLQDLAEREISLNSRRKDLNNAMVLALTPMAEAVPFGTAQQLDALAALAEVAPFGTSQGLNALEALADGRTVVAVGAGGLITRSVDAGRTWAVVPSRKEGINLVATALVGGTTVIAVGDYGEIVRSADAGAKWSKMPFVEKVNFNAIVALADGKTVIVAAYGWGIVRSTDAGMNWEVVVDTGSDFSSFAALTDGTTVIAVGGNGEIALSVDTGRNWSFPASGTDQDFSTVAALPDGKTVIAAGVGGEISRSGDAGKTWAVVPSGADMPLTALMTLADGKTVVAIGWDGFIARSINAGETWAVVPSGTPNYLNALTALADGKTVIAVGGDGVFTRSVDAGASWSVMPSATERELNAIATLSDGRTTIATGGGDVISRLTLETAEALQRIAFGEFTIGAGDETVSVLEEIWFSLPPHVYNFSGYENIRAEISEIKSEENSIANQRMTAQEKLDSLKNGTFDAGEKRAAFNQFFAYCNIVTPPVEGQTKACIEAWTAQNLSEAQTWWQALATTVPQGILVLFLLATLSSLYRYNLRVAGFHHSRADALALLASGPAATDVDMLVKITDTLAADKVSWGKAGTPSDQATEIAKAFLARKAE